MEIPSEESEREFLGQLLGRVLIAKHAQEIAMDGAGIAFHQGDLGGGDLLGGAAVDLEDQGPLRRELGEPRILLLLLQIHGDGLFSLE